MKLGSQTWIPESRLREEVLHELSQKFGEPNTGDGVKQWTESKVLGLHEYTIEFEPGSNEIEVGVRGLRILYLLIVLLPVLIAGAIASVTTGQGVLSLFLVVVGYVAICVFLFSPRRLKRLENMGSLAQRSNKPYAFFAIGFALLVLWTKLLFLFSNGLVTRFMLLISVVFVGYALSYDWLPGISTAPGVRVLAIPVIALSWMLVPPMLFVVFAFQPGWIYLRTQQIERNLEQLTPTQGNLSVISDVTGGTRLEALDLMAARGALTLAMVVVAIVVVVLVLMMYQGRYELRALRSVQGLGFESSRGRLLGLGTFFISNIGVVISAIPGITVLYYGLFGTFPFTSADLLYTQAFTSEPLEYQVTTYQLLNDSAGYREIVIEGTKNVQPTELITASYHVLDLAAQGLPLLPPRGWSLFIFGLMFQPQILLISIWASHGIRSFVSKLLAIRNGRDIDPDFEVVPDDISVLAIGDEESQYPICHPISIVFGWREYIVVGESVVDELSEEELEAVVAHEVYHLQNRDLQMNAIASLLSFGFGGRNALLAFYDYPRIEAEADQYAREHVGATPLIFAIDKMDVLAKKSSGQSIPGTAPGFLDYNLPSKAASTVLSRIYRVIERYSEAPQQLLFGPVLFQTAHADVETRIQRVRDEAQ